MIWIDFALIILIALSAVISVFRGFVREVLSLVAWVVAFLLAFKFSNMLAETLYSGIEIPSLRMAAAFISIFIVTLIGFSLFNYVIARLVEGTGLSGTDRVLGIVFGIARGIAIIVALVLLASLTPLPEEAWWKQSTLIPQFQELAQWVKGYVPDDFAKHFSFESSVISSTEAQTQ